MSNGRDKMNKALKNIVVPKLRERDFKGSFPHFRRVGKAKLDLLTFQFDKWGGGFVIEIAICPVDGILTHWGECIPPNKVHALHAHIKNRFRLQPQPGSSRHEWFRFDKSGKREPESAFVEVAESVIPFLDIAEKWWSENQLSEPG